MKNLTNEELIFRADEEFRIFERMSARTGNELLERFKKINFSPCERKVDSNNEQKGKKCHVPILNGVNQRCINELLDCNTCQFWHL